VVFGVKKSAKAALEIWNQADARYVGVYRGFPRPRRQGAPGSSSAPTGTPRASSPDLDAVEVAIQTALPVALTQADEKVTWKARNNKQASFFAWRISQQQALSLWFQERFGISACATQLFDRADIHQDVAVVATSGGVDNLWSFTSKG